MTKCGYIHTDNAVIQGVVTAAACGGGALVHTLFCSVSDPDLFFTDLDPGFFSQSGSGSGSGSR